MPSVRMRTTSAGPAGTRIAGQVYPVSTEEGTALVQAGYASWVDAPPSELPSEPQIERAVLPTPDNALAQPGQPNASGRPRRRR